MIYQEVSFLFFTVSNKFIFVVISVFQAPLLAEGDARARSNLINNNNLFSILFSF